MLIFKKCNGSARGFEPLSVGNYLIKRGRERCLEEFGQKENPATAHPSKLGHAPRNKKCPAKGWALLCLYLRLERDYLHALTRNSVIPKGGRQMNHCNAAVPAAFFVPVRSREQARITSAHKKMLPAKPGALQ